jgi:hypothetical protein
MEVAKPLISRQDALTRYPIGRIVRRCALPRERFSPCTINGNLELYLWYSQRKVALTWLRRAGMVELGVWSAAAVCMTVSLFISFWADRRFETFWPKFVFLLIASVIGIFLFPFFGGLWAGAAPQQEHLIVPAFRKQIWAVIGGVVAMAYFGAWRLQKIIDSRRKIQTVTAYPSPTRVKSAALTARRSLPVFPYEQTSAAPVGMSQRCQYLTYRSMLLHVRMAQPKAVMRRSRS